MNQLGIFHIHAHCVVVNNCVHDKAFVLMCLILSLFCLNMCICRKPDWNLGRSRICLDQVRILVGLSGPNYNFSLAREILDLPRPKWNLIFLKSLQWIPILTTKKAKCIILILIFKLFAIHVSQNNNIYTKEKKMLIIDFVVCIRNL